MQDDCITVALGLPEVRTEECRQEGETLVVTVRYRCMSRPCPGCGRETSHVHQYHRQSKGHAALWGRAVVLELRKRRFRCWGCGRVFMEPDEVCGWRRRSTRAFRHVLATGCRAATVKAVAEGAGVSEASVRRAFSEMAPGMIAPVAEAARVLALDELWIGARGGYLTLLYGVEERQVLALEPGRCQASAETVLMGQGEGLLVQAVVIDMTECFRQAARYACPGAAIVADKFHVLSRVLADLGRVVSRVQAKATGQDARILRHRRLFTAPTPGLSATERAERDRLRAIYPDLDEAWRIAEAFREIYQAASRQEARQRLDTWWDRVQRDGPREFRGLRHMLTHWHEEILNYFTYRVTNGFAEGKNNRIKAIIRAGYGYRNLTNLTQRIMLANPTTTHAREAFSPHLLT
jgi:transposase